jgi:predicted  nucleic acid-binding Zn-ribbon protein
MTMVIGGNDPEVHTSGEEQSPPTPGGLVCVECGYALSLLAQDTLPHCPACGGRSFRRSAMFEQTTVGVGAIEAADAEPDSVAAAREQLADDGPHLAWEMDGELRTMPIAVGWSKIGRSGSADLLLDDPTVSRRHALVVRTDEGELRALDDRSLNGLFVNGERVEWSPLRDGDELEIGAYRLYVIDI